MTTNIVRKGLAEEALRLQSAGMSQKAIASKLKISRDQVQYFLRSQTRMNPQGIPQGSPQIPQRGIPQGIQQGIQQETQSFCDQEMEQAIQQLRQGLSHEDIVFRKSRECSEGLLTKPPAGAMTRQEVFKWCDENRRQARKKFDDRRERERAEFAAQISSREFDQRYRTGRGRTR